MIQQIQYQRMKDETTNIIHHSPTPIHKWSQDIKVTYSNIVFVSFTLKCVSCANWCFSSTIQMYKLHSLISLHTHFMSLWISGISWNITYIIFRWLVAWTVLSCSRFHINESTFVTSIQVKYENGFQNRR